MKADSSNFSNCVLIVLIGSMVTAGGSDALTKEAVVICHQAIRSDRGGGGF